MKKRCNGFDDITSGFDSVLFTFFNFKSQALTSLAPVNNKPYVSLKMSTSGPITEFPAPGLRDPFRYITGHDAEGNAVFVQTDNGDHRAVMLGGAAAQNILYSAGSNPIELTGNVDLEFAKNRVRLSFPLHPPPYRKMLTEGSPPSTSPTASASA